MKKWLIGLIILLALIVGFAYFFIPGTLKISGSVTAKANPDAAFQSLRKDSVWKHCWPGTYSTNHAGKYQFYADGYSYFIKNVRLDAFEIAVIVKGDTIPSYFFVSPEVNNKVTLAWTTSIRSGKYPQTKLQRYFIARKLRTTFKKVLANFKAYVEDIINVYGFPIRSELVTFRYIMAYKAQYDHSPGVQEIYPMIDEVRKYIQESGGQEIGNPMLNIRPVDSLHYEAQVGIPVNVRLPGNEKIFAKWMYKGGDILITEVNGGNGKIEEAMKMTEKYIADYHHTIIAIPFQSLVTNRLNEPDSNKWKTLIYYPVVL